MASTTRAERHPHVVHVGPNPEGKTPSQRKLRGMAQASMLSDLQRIRALETENRRWKIALGCVAIPSVAAIVGLAVSLWKCRE